MTIRMSRKFFFIDFESLFDYNINIINRDLLYSCFEQEMLNFISSKYLALGPIENPSFLNTFNHQINFFSDFIIFKEGVKSISDIKAFKIPEEELIVLKERLYFYFLELNIIEDKNSDRLISSANLYRNLEILLIIHFTDVVIDVANVVAYSDTLEDFCISMQELYPTANRSHFTFIYQKVAGSMFHYEFPHFMHSFARNKKILRGNYLIDKKEIHEVRNYSQLLIEQLDDVSHTEIINRYRTILETDDLYFFQNLVDGISDIISHLDFLILDLRHKGELKQ